MARKKSLSTKALEEEIAALEAEQRGSEPDNKPDIEAEDTVKTQEKSRGNDDKEADIKADTDTAKQDSDKSESLSPEERTWKKRYADLRRHQQKQTNDLKEEISSLKGKLSEVGDSASLASEDEIKAWVETNPKAAAVVRNLARSMADEQISLIKDELGELQDLKSDLDSTRVQQKVLKEHADFYDITESDEFHDWLESRSKKIQDMAYGTDSDDVIDVLNLYKNFMNITTKEINRKAATSAGKSSAAPEPKSSKVTKFTESEVEAMTTDEYEAQEEAILEAMRTGNFEYDIKARQAAAR